jgi:hypothetical protein
MDLPKLSPSFFRVHVCQQVCWVVLVLLGGAAQAQEVASALPGQADSSEAAQAKRTLDLGRFIIRDLRPTRNETAKVTLSLHLTFSEAVTEQQFAQLQHWKHRLRDQVITAVRISEIKDFQEPNLSHLRHQILIRVNRLLKTKLAEDVLLTEYLFRLH